MDKLVAVGWLTASEVAKNKAIEDAKPKKIIDWPFPVVIGKIPGWGKDLTPKARIDNE